MPSCRVTRLTPESVSVSRSRTAARFGSPERGLRSGATPTLRFATTQALAESWKKAATFARCSSVSVSRSSTGCGTKHPMRSLAFFAVRYERAPVSAYLSFLD